MAIDNSRFLLALVSPSLQSNRSSFSTLTGSTVETGHITVGLEVEEAIASPHTHPHYPSTQ